MKRVIFTVIISVIVGGLFGIIYFKSVRNNIVNALKSDDVVYAFQVGVYRNYDNALDECSKYESGVVVFDNDFYRVFISLSNNQEVINKLSLLYKNKSIVFYLKEVQLPEEFLIDFKNYQMILLNTTDYDEVNKNMMKEYSDILNGVYN